MWAVFCSLNQVSLPGGWRRILSVGPVTLATQGPAEAPGVPRGGQLLPGHGADVPACPCCYYTTSLQLDPDNDPGLRTCGWFWDEHRQSWVWWHGQAPHAPFPYPHQNLLVNQEVLTQELEPGEPEA